MLKRQLKHRCFEKNVREAGVLGVAGEGVLAHSSPASAETWTEKRAYTRTMGRAEATNYTASK